MRFILFAILSTFILSSCDKDDAISKLNENDSSALQTKSNDIPNPIDQLEGMPVNIKLIGQVSNDYNYLSSSAKSYDVDRHSEDDGSKRQRWLISRNYNSIFGNNYSIKVEGGAKVNGRIGLRGGPEEYNPVLEEGMSIDPYFGIENIPNTSNYNITHKRQYGMPNPILEKLYLYAKGSGRELVVGRINNLDSRAKWEITPVEDLELQSISYKSIIAGEKFDPILMYSGNRQVNNGTESPIKHTIKISEKVSESSTFSKTEGISVTNKISVGGKVGLPVINVGGEINTEHTTSNTWEFQESKTNYHDRTLEDIFDITIPAYKKYIINIKIVSYNLDVIYIATFKGTVTGTIIQLKGRWKGVECIGIDYDAIDEKGTPVKIPGLRNIRFN